MDTKLNQYRSAIKDLLTQLAQWSNQSDDYPGVESTCVFDDVHDQYLLLNVGWQGDRRQRGLPVYIRIKDGKVWLEEDCTDMVIADRLVEAGIPQSDIVLGFKHPSLRAVKGFAAA